MPQTSWRITTLNLVLLLLVVAGVIFIPRLFLSFNPVALVGLALLLYGITALNRARNLVSPPRIPLLRTTHEEWGLPPFEEVTFPSQDGVELSGWYIPSKNQAAVIMIHSFGGSRAQMRHYARPLVESGYGILLFDLRAHARSDGALSAFGWLEVKDLLGAVEFIKSRTEVDPTRLGVLGVSLGAQIALRGAALCPDIQAVWADGPTPIVFRDHFGTTKPGFRQQFFTPWWALAYRMQEWLTGLKQPAPLVEVIGKVSPRPIFIAVSGNTRLIQIARQYFDAAEEPKGWWQMDDIPFATGILEKGDDYDFKLTGFFNKAL